MIISEDGVRFYVSENTNSAVMTEVFLGNTGSPFVPSNAGLQLPNFVNGTNTIVFTNTDGDGQELVNGSASVSVGGSIGVVDIDNNAQIMISFSISQPLIGEYSLPYQIICKCKSFQSSSGNNRLASFSV